MQYKYKISLADIDTDYKMSINSVLGFFQDAIARFFDFGNIGPKHLLRNGMFWVITEFHSNIVGKFPVWPSSTSVEVWISNISALKTYVDYTMTDETGQTYATGTSVWSILDSVSRRPLKCLEQRNLTRLFDEKSSVSHEKYRFLSTGKEIASVSHKIDVTEIDFNGHTHNESYLRLACTMESSEFLSRNSISKLHIHFANESFLGDESCCTLRLLSPGNYSSTITKDEGRTVLCQINSEWNSTEMLQDR